MEMRAIEDIAIGQDLTPPLPPLSAVLHDSALSSYCSACFSALPPQPFPPFTPAVPQNSCHVPSNTPTPLYCSARCSSLDSPLHFSSAEAHLLSLFGQSPLSTWNDSSDLRLSLRLFSIFQKHYSRSPGFLGSSNSYQRLFFGEKIDCPLLENENIRGPDDYALERIAGLMTNREKLVFGEENKNNQFKFSDQRVNTDENSGNCDDLERIREGPKMMAKARTMYINENVNVENQEEFVLEEMILCMVQTNAVEVQDKSGCSIGIAVYGTKFSWINHSCSPNACYWFLVGLEHDEQTPLRITSAAKSDCCDVNRNRLIMDGDLEYPFSERNDFGPRVVVHSIKAVNKGEEVTIAYTDLLQPKEMRQAELWSKYRFCCGCNRCGAVPTGYVDYTLNALSAANPDTVKSPDNKIDELMQRFNAAITDYLSFGDPKSCRKKLEDLLSHGLLCNESLESNEATSPQKLKLHPFHHLSLNAYTTLASAYKVEASDLLGLNDENGRHKLEALNFYRTSAAYSLLLAGISNHLFMFESGIVASVANFWINAGESMLNLAKSSLWDTVLKPWQDPLHFSSFLAHKCSICGLAHTLEDQNMQLDEIKSQLLSCIANITPKVWSTLASESSFLRLIRSPIEFSWLASLETSMKGSSQWEDEKCDDKFRINLILLGVHCLRYGALLSSICYGFSVEMNYCRTFEFSKEAD
ncbi:Histone-lysine N-methyltransferase [Handroanthus impetiginosus]|uniref:Histone-lysine N-methyltransferase n=1 Tax=Handroanthus impetiginosus TaxID=429701 RepID=A0A2G9G9H7_9LAMI|nr:Histone-lysine N-methyltransferase [Handroanthus impetiginosus]